jgi:hypothetical protein
MLGNAHPGLRTLESGGHRGHVEVCQDPQPNHGLLSRGKGFAEQGVDLRSSQKVEGLAIWRHGFARRLDEARLLNGIDWSTALPAPVLDDPAAGHGE